MYFLLFPYYLPFEKDVALHLNKLECPSSIQKCFVSNLVEIGPVDLEKKIFKSYQFIFTISQ